MKTGIATVIACCALLLTAGCGSSGSPTTSSSTGTATTTAATTTTASSGKSELRSDTTPKFVAPSSSESVHSGVVQIAYRNITIEPDTLRVKVGSTVKWTNYDPVQANVTSVGPSPQKLASKNFGEGSSFEVKLEKPGVIHYECTLYPATMNGTIEVVS